MSVKQVIRICGLVIILICPLLISCGPSPEEQAATSVAQTAAAATDTPTPTSSPTPTEIPPTFTPSPSPTPTFTPTPEPQVVLLRRGCERDHNIIANYPLQLHYGIWGSIGKAYAEGAWDLLDVELRIEGEPIYGEKQPIAADLVKPCGYDVEDSYWQFYIANIEGIPPGVHYLEVAFYAHEPITDGTGKYYGPGTILTHTFTLHSATD